MNARIALSKLAVRVAMVADARLTTRSEYPRGRTVPGPQNGGPTPPESGAAPRAPCPAQRLPVQRPRLAAVLAKALNGLPVTRLRWPADQRPASGAALNAKTVVIDRSIAFITSANVTMRAAGDNIEAGLLVRGGDIPLRLADHVGQLLQAGVLLATQAGGDRK